MGIDSTDFATGIFSEDGWFFLGNDHFSDLDQGLGNFILDPAHAEAWATTLADIDVYCRSRGVATLFTVSPAKWAIYPEKLLQFTEVTERVTMFDLILEECRTKNIGLLDLRRALIDAKSTAETYSPRDSHWSAFGAAVAWNEIAEALKEKLPEYALPPSPTIKSIHYTDEADEATALSGKPGMNRHARAVFESVYSPLQVSFNGGAWQWIEGSRVLPLVSMPYRTKSPGVENQCKALIIRDSVGDQLSPFFHGTFHQTIQTYHHLNHVDQILDIPKLVSTNSPDVLIFILTERYLTQPWPDSIAMGLVNLFESSDIAAAIWPGSSRDTYLDIQEWENMRTPVRCVLPQNGCDDLILKLTISATEAGTLVTSYGVENTSFEKIHKYQSGISSIYCQVPGRVSGQNFWFSDMNDRGRTHLVSVEVRKGYKNKGQTPIGNVALIQP